MQFPSVRFNRNKQQNRKLSNILWEKNAYQYEEQMTFITDPLWHGGAYYVQESSSMFLGYMMEQLIKRKILQDDRLCILDLCAAPGGKTTHVIDKICSNNLVVANEVIPKRNAILRENLARWGNANVIVTQNFANDFVDLNSFFDVLIVDAPCSGEGLFRKSPEARNEWSEDNVEMCVLRQREILQQSISLLKETGILFYSTCTFQKRENEDHISWLLENGFEMIPFDVSAFPEIEEGYLPNTFRFRLEKVKGSGFFIACLQKKRDIVITLKSRSTHFKRNYEKIPIKIDFQESLSWIGQPEAHEFYLFKQKIFAIPKVLNNSVASIIDSNLRITSIGTEIGELKKTIFIPSHELALSDLVRKDIQYVDVNKETALQYLRKNELHLDSTSHTLGWTLIRYEGINLGWIKMLNGRINNYLPNSFRILHY